MNHIPLNPLRIWLAALAVMVTVSLTPSARALDPGVRQLVVSVAPDWDSTRGIARCFERGPGGGAWKPVGPAWPVNYGRSGLAWGRGVLGNDEPGGPRKVERDGRAPAGVFRIGKVYTADAALPSGSDYPFHTITTSDAWVDDPNFPEQYNRFLTIPDPANPPAWFEKGKMRHGDFAYRWLVEIRHNADPAPVVGAGSAIFFHLRRGETRPSSGCTVMAEPNLVRLLRWLRAEARPQYTLLPQAEYAKRWQAWGLPDPTALRAE